jgi:hypothetical protein
MPGYRFAPRFADLGDQRFWRTDLPDGTPGGYGPLEAIARNGHPPRSVRCSPSTAGSTRLSTC